MIGYLCKYTPIELFRGFHENPELIAPSPLGEQDANLHPNLCSYAKTAYRYCTDNHISEIVFTNCCDSLKRISDVLKSDTSFHVMLNLPRVQTEESVRLFARELMKFIQKYEAYADRKFDSSAFKQAVRATRAAEDADTDFIALLGARMPEELLKAAQECCTLPIRDLTCTGQERRFSAVPETKDLAELMEWYAAELLGQLPCMRMQDISSRKAFYASPRLKGIIYHTIKFCDYYGFEYTFLKKHAHLPILKLETDYTEGMGQIRTRIEAFWESLGLLADSQKSAPPRAYQKRKFFAGVDSGSTSTDAVLLDGDLQIIAYSILPTGGRSIDGARAALEDVLHKGGIDRDQLANIVATGYGRNAVEMGSNPVTEITCHAKGAYHLDHSVRTIIDIGGQDSKIIKLDSQGNILDFSMNDKCAAGTGRFLEMMASTLGMDLEDFARMGLDWSEDIKISSMCSVFAESEVISLIAQNKAKPDIIHGINQSITTRIFAMIARLNCAPVYMMTGGVAKNKGVVLELSGKLGCELITDSEPQICGALGAALIAAGKQDC